jgi:phage shock protein A
MSEERADYCEQPNPTDGQANVTPVLRTLLIDMLDARAAAGLERYGKPLQTRNGRDAERDLLEELIDAAQYAVQSRMEREDLRAEIERLQTRVAKLEYAARFAKALIEIRPLFFAEADAQDAIERINTALEL